MDEMLEARLEVLNEQPLEDLQESVAALIQRLPSQHLVQRYAPVLQGSNRGRLARTVIELEDLCCSTF